MARSQRPIWLGEDHRKWDHVRLHLQVAEDPRLDAYDLAVYVGLVIHADLASGKAWPSTRTIGAYFGVSDRKTRDVLGKLEGLGYVRIERETGESSTYFVLQPPLLPRHLVPGSDEGTAAPDAAVTEATAAPPAAGRGTSRQPTAAPRADEQEPGNENQERSLFAPPPGDADARPAVLLGFEAFWTAWPARNGKKLYRGKAEPLWAKLGPDDRRAALAGALNYADASAAGLAGAMDAFRWLRDRSWADWQEPAVPDPRPGRSAAGDGLSPAAREELARHYQGNGHPRDRAGSALPSGPGGR